MSDYEADPDLLELLRRSGQSANVSAPTLPDTFVLRDAEYIYNNTADVAIDMKGTQNAARLIWQQMQERAYSTKSWSENELHPKGKDEATLNFIFTMDLLNYSFWSSLSTEDRFAIAYRDKCYTGYQSLVAAVNRALDEEIPITTPSFWQDDGDLDADKMNYIFRSATDEQMPLLDERLYILREAGRVLATKFNGSVVELIRRADQSAVGLVNLLADQFGCFRDEATFHGRSVRFLKRASIFVADVWAAFNGESYGAFGDIDRLTMFADYRLPQILYSLGCISYSPPLDSHIRRMVPLENGHEWEVAIRGCSVWSVEMIRRRIVQDHPEAVINAVLIDFFLYDLAKEREQAGHEAIPHHRTRSIWY